MFLHNWPKVGLSLFKYVCYSTRDSISLNQKSYLEEVLLQFGIDICKPAFSLIDSRVLNYILLVSENHQADKNTIFWYKVIVDLLIYAMIMIWLDLGYTWSMISWYYTKPNSSHISEII